MAIQIKIIVSQELTGPEARIDKRTFGEIWAAKNLGVPYADEVLVGDPFIQCYMLRLSAEGTVEAYTLVVSDFVKEHFYSGKDSLSVVPLPGR
jgi:hypothetical protein